MKRILVLALTLYFAPPAMAGSIQHWKCGPFNIRIEPVDDYTADINIARGKEDRGRQYDFIRVKLLHEWGTPPGDGVFWSGVKVKDRRVIMAGTLLTIDGRTTYTEKSFLGERGKPLGKVVKTCIAID